MQAVDRGLSWLWRLTIILGLAIGVMMPPLLLQLVNELTGVKALTGWRVTAVILYFCLFLGISGIACAVYRHYTGEMTFKKLTWSDLWLIGGGYLVIIGGEGLFQFINQVIYHQSETQNNAAIEDLMSGSSMAMIMMAVSAVFLTPIMEELVFRAVLTNLFLRQEPLKVLLSAVVFGSMHASTTLPSFLIYFTMGLILASVYRISGKIQDSIILHFLINAGAMSLMLLSWQA